MPLSRFVTSNLVVFLKEVLLFAEQTAEDWNKVVPEVYAFKRDCRRALNVIQPLIEVDHEFEEFLLLYIRNEAQGTHNYGDYRGIIVELVKDMIATQKDLDEFIERIKTTPEGSPASNGQARFERLINSREYRVKLDSQRQNIAKLLIDLDRNCRYQDSATKKKIPKLEDFKSDFKSHSSMAGYNFWKKYVGPDTSVAWCTFVHAYERLYGSSETSIDLADIKEHLATKEGEQGEEVDTMTLYAFITLVDQHDFPFARNAEILSKRKRVLSDEARMEVAKMVMKLMDQFTSKDMQDNFLMIEQLYEGLDKKDTVEIEKRAKDWGALRKESRMMSETLKTDEHKKADKIDFARRSVSFLYQRYMVIWRVGQLERDTLKEVDFPGTGRIREFLAYYLPLDKVNFHDVRGLEDERWESAKPNVYKFLEQLIQNKTKDVEKEEKRKKKEEEEQKQETEKRKLDGELAAEFEPMSPQPSY